MLIANMASLGAATTGTGNELDLSNHGSVHVAAYLITDDATVSAGSVLIEEAQASGYGGTWQALLSPITPVQDSVLAWHLEGAFGVVRARIATDVTGGATVTVVIRATSHGG